MSDGVIRGIVTNIDKTIMAIELLAVASEQSGIEINVVNVGIAGQHIKYLFTMVALPEIEWMMKSQ